MRHFRRHEPGRRPPRRHSRHGPRPGPGCWDRPRPPPVPDRLPLIPSDGGSGAAPRPRRLSPAPRCPGPGPRLRLRPSCPAPTWVSARREGLRPAPTCQRVTNVWPQRHPTGRRFCRTVLGVRGAADELGGLRGPSRRRPFEVWPRGVTPTPGRGRVGLSRRSRSHRLEGAAGPRDPAGPSREGSDGNAAAPARLSACQQRETAPAAGPGAAAPRRAALQKPLRRKAERSAGHAVPPQHRRAVCAFISSEKSARSGAGREEEEESGPCVPRERRRGRRKIIIIIKIIHISRIREGGSCRACARSTRGRGGTAARGCPCAQPAPLRPTAPRGVSPVGRS